MSIDTNATKALVETAERAVQLAKRAGADAADVLMESGTEFRGDVLDGRAENIKQAQRRGLGLRVIVDQRVAVVYTSDFRAKALEDLAQRALSLAKRSTPDEFAALPEGALATPHDEAAMALYDPAVADLPAGKKIAMAIEMERIAKAQDKRIKRMDGCSITTNHGATVLASSNGGALTYHGTQIALFANPLAEDEGGRQQSGAYVSRARSLDAVEAPEQVALEAATRAVSRLGAKPVNTQKVPVMMHPEIAGNWLQNVFGAFNGDAVFKKTSYLAEKLGETIASPLVTIVDDGIARGRVSSAPFDGEGRPTKRNVLVDKGVCRMFVYDDYWARKSGTQSTGSAGRQYTGTPFVSNHNLYIENGGASPADIRRGIAKGFYIVDTGAFGYNQTTGAYSYAAAGFWIEKGEIAHPVQEITVASTTLDMLKNVSKVGNDLKFNGSVNSPTLLISEMTISGKEA